MYGFIEESIIRHNFLTGEGKCYNVYRTKSDLEAGYIFAPHIPLQLEPLQVERDDFQPNYSITSRYAQKIVNNRFYGNITVGEFDSLGND
jgi:hypothetical protein